MFDIGWSEMALILFVAVVVIGPKDLPRLARTLGQWSAKARSMAREFHRSLDEMAREADLQDIKKEIDRIRTTDVKGAIADAVDPEREIKKALQAPEESGSRRKVDPSSADRDRLSAGTLADPPDPHDPGEGVVDEYGGPAPSEHEAAKATMADARSDRPETPARDLDGTAPAAARGGVGLAERERPAPEAGHAETRLAKPRPAETRPEAAAAHAAQPAAHPGPDRLAGHGRVVEEARPITVAGINAGVAVPSSPTRDEPHDESHDERES